MRSTTLFIIFAVGALGFLAYVGKQMGIKTPSMPSLNMPNIQMPNAMNSLLRKEAKEGEEQSSTNVTAYKWQDAEGQWHYGNQAPAGAKASAIMLNTDQNVIAAHKIKPPVTPETSAAEETQNTDKAKNNDDNQDLDLPSSALPLPYQEVQKMLGLHPSQAQSK